MFFFSESSILSENASNEYIFIKIGEESILNNYQSEKIISHYFDIRNYATLCQIKKTVFVTVGTTKFDDLITTVLSRVVLEVLSARNYRHLILQIGNSKLELDCTARYGFHKIEIFGLSPSIGEYMELADLVISHAGAGSVLEALEKRKHLIVVTNDLLMDNHQIELAEQLYKDEHLYYCTCKNLLHVIQTMDLAKLKPFTNDKSTDIANFIDKVMGFR